MSVDLVASRPAFEEREERGSWRGNSTEWYHLLLLISCSTLNIIQTFIHLENPAGRRTYGVKREDRK